MLCVTGTLVCLLLERHDAFSSEELNTIKRLIENESTYSANILEAALDEKSEMLARCIEQEVRKFVLSDDIEGLGFLLESACREEEVVYAYLIDKRDEILSSQMKPDILEQGCLDWDMAESSFLSLTKRLIEENKCVELKRRIIRPEGGALNFVLGISNANLRKLKQTLKTHTDWILAIATNLNRANTSSVKFSFIVLILGGSFILAVVLQATIRRLIVKRIMRLSAVCSEIEAMVSSCS